MILNCVIVSVLEFILFGCPYGNCDGSNCDSSPQSNLIVFFFFISNRQNTLAVAVFIAFYFFDSLPPEFISGGGGGCDVSVALVLLWMSSVGSPIIYL